MAAPFKRFVLINLNCQLLCVNFVQNPESTVTPPRPRHRLADKRATGAIRYFVGLPKESSGELPIVFRLDFRRASARPCAVLRFRGRCAGVKKEDERIRFPGQTPGIAKKEPIDIRDFGKKRGAFASLFPSVRNLAAANRAMVPLISGTLGDRGHLDVREHPVR